MSYAFPPAPDPATELGRYKILSKTAGIRVSPLQLGAMSIGDAWAEYMGRFSQEEANRLLDAYYNAGGNFIDTANNYQDEQSESWIGAWMKARGNRDKLVIATKYSLPYKTYELGPGLAVNYGGNSRRSLHMSVHDSLEKLQTDWIDILYVHYWDHTTSTPEIMNSLHTLVVQGKVLYLGVSDTPAWIVSAANEYATMHGKTPFSVYQGKWSILDRDFEREIIPMARHYGMALAPWGTLGMGKIKTKAEVEARRKRGEGLRGSDQTEQEIKISEGCAKIAKEHGSNITPTGVALAYVLQKTSSVFPIVGGRKVEHLQDNIAALSIKLTPQQVEYLESLTDFKIGFPSDFVGEDPKVSGTTPWITASSAQYSWS